MISPSSYHQKLIHNENKFSGTDCLSRNYFYIQKILSIIEMREVRTKRYFLKSLKIDRSVLNAILDFATKAKILEITQQTKNRTEDKKCTTYTYIFKHRDLSTDEIFSAKMFEIWVKAMSPIEKARAFALFVHQGRMNINSTAEHLGIGRSTAHRYLNMLDTKFIEKLQDKRTYLEKLVEKPVFGQYMNNAQMKKKADEAEFQVRNSTHRINALEIENQELKYTIASLREYEQRNKILLDQIDHMSKMTVEEWANIANLKKSIDGSDKIG